MDIDTLSMSLCRICLSQDATYPIFDEANENSIYCKLSKCFTEKVEDEEGYPRHICSICNNTLNLMYEFMKKYEESTKILKNSIDILKIEAVSDFSDNNSDFDWPDENLSEIKLENNNEHVETKPTDIIEKLNLPGLQVTKVKIKPKAINKRKKITNKTATSVLEHEFEWSGQKWCLPTRKTSFKKNPSKEKGIKPNEQVKRPEDKVKLCNICGNTFKDIRKLKNHINKVHSEERLNCSICSRKFHSQHCLKQHKLTVHGDRNFKCSMCTHAFTQRYGLNRHIRSVHNKHLKPNRNFACRICNKTYKCQKSLIIHERSTHTGFRPALCNVCSKSFFHEEYLKEHMRLHTGELPFKCPICDRGCTQLGNMKSHLRIHKISELTETIRSKLKPNYLKLLKNC